MKHHAMLLLFFLQCLVLQALVAQQADFLYRKGFPASSGSIEKSVRGIEDIYFYYSTPYY